MAKVVTDDKHYKDIADALRDRNGTVNAYKPSEMAQGVIDLYWSAYHEGDHFGRIEGYGHGYDEGHTAGYDEGYNEGSNNSAAMDYFWDAYQIEGLRDDYNYGFAGSGWNSETYFPRYPIKTRSGYLFYYSGIDDTKVNITIIATSTINSLFSNTKQLRIIRHLDISSYPAGKGINWFGGANVLEEIENIVGEIKHINLNLSGSSKLSHDTLLRVLNALADVTSDTSSTVWKITLGSTNRAKLTATELKIAENKGWTVS